MPYTIWFADRISQLDSRFSRTFGEMGPSCGLPETDFRTPSPCQITLCNDNNRIGAWVDCSCIVDDQNMRESTSGNCDPIILRMSHDLVGRAGNAKPLT